MRNIVFISYETTTGLNLARHLSMSLSKLNLASFVAERDIQKGDDWRTSIDKALNDCNIFVLIITNLALKSEEVKKEIEYAMQNNKEIFPCKKTNVSDEKVQQAFPLMNKLQRINFKDEFELSDSIIEVLIDKEINDSTENKLSPFYKNLEKVGSGGFGDIFKAIRRIDNKIVAVYVINRTDQNGKKIITNSASIWSNLKHPNIVELTGVNLTPILFIEEEYCDSSLVSLKFPLNLNVAINIMLKLCNGLLYAHNLGIVHGDLKPSNILFQNGEPKISDWGFSSDAKSKLGETIILTPNYASPEQFRFEKIDVRSDIYQLGIIFYELVTNTNPIQIGASLSRAYSKTILISPHFANQITRTERENIMPPSTVNTEAKKLDSVIMKLLEPDKNDRYQTLNEVISDLKKIPLP